MSKTKILHFIGVGGISMSALAIMAKAEGFIVQGSDITSSKITDELKKKKINVFIGHNPQMITCADIVVYSSAINKNDPELKQAKKLKKVIVKRAELLSYFASLCNSVLAISGTHGKTTTTAMSYHILKSANLSPTLHIGGELVSGKNYAIGKKNIFITEACEYKNNFRFLTPTIAVVLNIEEDHLDYFKTKERIVSCFKAFAKKAEIVVCNENIKQCFTNARIITFGFNKGDYTAKNITVNKNSICFDCFAFGKKLCGIQIASTQKHNVLNALASIASCKLLGSSCKQLQKGLKSFKGVKRRYQTILNSKFGEIIIDYAHHPTEIKDAIENFDSKDKNSFIIFQPHTYSRTKTLMNDFVDVFANVKCNLILFKTYSAREAYDKAGSAQVLAENISAIKECKYAETFEDITNIILKTKTKVSVLILGAGNIDSYADYLKEHIKDNI